MIKQLANLIKKTRKEQGYSQKTLAEGITNQAVMSRIEKAEVAPTIDIFFQLIKKLNIPIEKVTDVYNITATKNNSFYSKELSSLFYKRDYEGIDYVVRNTNVNSLSVEDKLEYEYTVASLLYLREKNGEKAVSKLTDLLAKVEEYSLNYFRIKSTIATILDDLERYEEAMVYFEEILPSISLLDEESKSRFLYSISSCYRGQKKYDKALYYTTVLIEDLIRNQNLHMLGDAYLQQSYIYTNLKLYSQAVDSINKAVTLFDIEKNDIMKNIALAKLIKIREEQRTDENN